MTRSERIAADRAFCLAHGRRIRHEAGLALETVAADLHVTIATLSRWETGRSRVPDSLVGAWAAQVRRLEAALASVAA